MDPQPNPIDFTWMWSTLSAAGGAFVTWLFARRKQKAEAVDVELANVHKAVEIWRQTAEDLKEEVEKLKSEIKELQKLVTELHVENINLKKQIAGLKP